LLEPPIDKRIGMLEPRHSEDHRMNSDGCDVKSMALRNATDRDVESDLTIRLKNTTVGDSDSDRRTWFGG